MYCVHFAVGCLLDFDINSVRTVQYSTVAPPGFGFHSHIRGRSLHRGKRTAGGGEADAMSKEAGVGHRVLFRLVRSVLFSSLKGMFCSFPFFFRVFGDL